MQNSIASHKKEKNEKNLCYIDPDHIGAFLKAGKCFSALDINHCGLLPLFDEIITSHKTAMCLKNEHLGKNRYREKNPLHKPYINICKVLTSYSSVVPNKLVPLRKAIIQRLGVGQWQIFGAHGYKKDYSTNA